MPDEAPDRAAIEPAAVETAASQEVARPVVLRRPGWWPRRLSRPGGAVEAEPTAPAEAEPAEAEPADAEPAAPTLAVDAAMTQSVAAPPGVEPGATATTAFVESPTATPPLVSPVVAQPRVSAPAPADAPAPAVIPAPTVPADLWSTVSAADAAPSSSAAAAPTADVSAPAASPAVLPVPRPIFPPRVAPDRLPAPVPDVAPAAVAATAVEELEAPLAIPTLRVPPKVRTAAGVLIRVVVVAIVVKLALDAAIGAFSTPTLGGVFPAFDSLPVAQRQALDARFAAVAGGIRGASGADLKAKVQQLVDGGMPRLDDALLAEHERLWAAAFSGTDTPTCAAVAHAAMTGNPYPPELDKMLASQGPVGYGRVLEIIVTAMEAQVRGTPAARSVTQDASDAMFARLFAELSPEDMATMSAEQDGIPQAADAVCTAQRHFLAAVLKLDPADLVTYEIWSVTP